MLDLAVTHVRPGGYVALERGIYEVITYEHHKPGKGGAVVRLKLKHLDTGTTLEKTMDADAKVSVVEVSDEPAQFLFRGGDVATFMMLESFEQVELSVAALGGNAGYLKPDIEVKLVECEGKVLGVKFPNSVDLKVTDTPPGVKGDTVTRGTKPATMETGIVVQVPLFINPGEMIRVDTRSGEYVGRV